MTITPSLVDRLACQMGEHVPIPRWHTTPTDTHLIECAVCHMPGYRFTNGDIEWYWDLQNGVRS